MASDGEEKTVQQREEKVAPQSQEEEKISQQDEISTPPEKVDKTSSSEEEMRNAGADSATAKIKNPLAHMTPEEVTADVDEFVQANGFQDQREMLVKGALIAKDPVEFESVPGITYEEVTVIRNEVLHRWWQPWRLYFTIVLCSIGAAVQGWDQTGSNGANLTFPDALGIPITETIMVNGEEVPNPDAALNQWIKGVINAGPYIACSMLGCWMSDPINYYFGRRGTIFTSAVFCFLAPFGSAVSQTWPQLFVTRLLLGIGMGCKASTIPIFCAENVPAAVRGGLVMSWQMWTAFGIWLGTCANLAVMNTGALSWRLQVGSAFIPALPLLLGVYVCPESPRWYIKKGRYQNAYRSLQKLRNHEIQVARDLFYIFAQLRMEASLVTKKSNYVQRFFELFTIPRVRRATLASWVVMIAQQMCGINIIAFYSSTVFAKAGASNKEALYASFGFGLVNFLFAFPAVWTIDTFGRRSLLLFTFPQMTWTLLAAGLCYLIPENLTAHLALMALFIYLFAAFYSPGEGPVPFTYSAEVFPLSHREVGMSWAVATCFFFAAVLSITFPRMVETMTVAGAFGFYAGLNALALVMIFFWLPETKQRTLEELDYIFDISTRKFMAHQSLRVLPWWVNTYVFRRKVGACPSLWAFEGAAQDDKGFVEMVRQRAEQDKREREEGRRASKKEGEASRRGSKQ